MAFFNELLSTQNVNVARFARNVEWDFFSEFWTISVLFGNGKYLACVCYIHCFFIIVRLRNFFPLSLLFYAIPVSFGDFPLSIVVLWGTIVDKWLPIKIVFCCPHLLPVIYENEAIYCKHKEPKKELSLYRHSGQKY